MVFFYVVSLWIALQSYVTICRQAWMTSVQLASTWWCRLTVAHIGTGFCSFYFCRNRASQECWGGGTAPAERVVLLRCCFRCSFAHHVYLFTTLGRMRPAIWTRFPWSQPAATKVCSAQQFQTNVFTLADWGSGWVLQTNANSGDGQSQRGLERNHKLKDIKAKQSEQTRSSTAAAHSVNWSNQTK